MPSRDGARVFVGNLPHDVRERDIERFFEKYGRVRNIFLKNGRYGFCVSTKPIRAPKMHRGWGCPFPSLPPSLPPSGCLHRSVIDFVSSLSTAAAAAEGKPESPLQKVLKEVLAISLCSFPPSLLLPLIKTLIKTITRLISATIVR